MLENDLNKREEIYFQCNYFNYCILTTKKKALETFNFFLLRFEKKWEKYELFNIREMRKDIFDCIRQQLTPHPQPHWRNIYSLFEFENILVQRHVTVFPREANGKINFRKFTRSNSEEDTSEPSRRCNYGGANSVK